MAALYCIKRPSLHTFHYLKVITCCGINSTYWLTPYRPLPLVRPRSLSRPVTVLFWELVIFGMPLKHFWKEASHQIKSVTWHGSASVIDDHFANFRNNKHYLNQNMGEGGRRPLWGCRSEPLSYYMSEAWNRHHEFEIHCMSMWSWDVTSLNAEAS